MNEEHNREKQLNAIDEALCDPIDGRASRSRHDLEELIIASGRLRQFEPSTVTNRGAIAWRVATATRVCRIRFKDDKKVKRLETRLSTGQLMPPWWH